jgi:hypothetical protein
VATQGVFSPTTVWAQSGTELEVSRSRCDSDVGGCCHPQDGVAEVAGKGTSLRTVAYERRKKSHGKGRGLSGSFGQLLDRRELEGLLRELIQTCC